MSKIAEKQSIKRLKIFDSAYELFTNKTFTNTTIDDVVKKAGIAKGTFYLYFKDKYDLLDRLIVQKSEEVLEEAFESLEAQKDEASMSFSQKTKFLVNYIIDYMEKHKELIILLEKKLSKCLYAFSNITNKKLQMNIDKLISSNEKEGISREETDKKVYMIVDLIGSVCFDAIVYEKPFKLDEMRPLLLSAVDNILA